MASFKECKSCKLANCYNCPLPKQPTVIQAARTVLAHCDGARTWDGVGFNKIDTGFVRSIVEQADNNLHITFKQESALYKILRKYIRQLDSYGIDYNRISKPVEKNKKVEEKDSPMKLEYQDFRLILYSPFSFREQARAIPTARWKPEIKAWAYLARSEVYSALEPYITSGRVKPSTEARTALDLAYAASQQRSRAESIKKNNFKKAPLPVKTKPYEHQDTAFQIAQTLDQSALLMEQGTGKTLSAIATAGYRYSRGQIKRLLIVAPLSVSYVWESEFEKHADFDYSLVNLASVKNKKKDKKLEELGSGLQVVVINYESSWRYIDQLVKWNPEMIIADESQKIKNGRAKQSKGLFKLGDMVKYKMILTGTPITQGPLDTWSQYRFLNPDIFGRRYLSFRDRYAIMESLRGRPEIRLVTGYKNLEELADKAHSIAFRVTKAEALDLPPTIDQTILVQLSSETQKIYKMMEKDFMVTFSDTKVATAPIILTQLLRLQQITGGFLHTEDKTIEKFDSSKLEAIKELLSDLPSDKKVVIFARFSPEVEALKKISQSLGKGTLTLEGSTRNRGEVIRAFQDNPDVKVIVIQVQTGGLGITLTSANIAIFYSTTFSFADYEQAKARLHRIGQHHPVTYIHLIAEGTVDEDILGILRSKGDMASLIVDSMRKKISSKPFTNPEKSFILDSMKLKGNKKEVKTKNLKNSEEEGNDKKKELNMIALDSKASGGWWYDEDTGNISRREPGGTRHYLAKKVETLERAQELVANYNKKFEGAESVMAKTPTKKLSRKERREAEKKKKASQVIEETAEEVAEEVEEEVAEKSAKTPKKLSKKEARKAKAKAAKEAEEKAEADRKAKKSKKEAKKDTKRTTKKEKASTREPLDDDLMGVKELADQINMDPKALRKVLREEFPDHEPKSQWTWKRGSKELTKLIKKLNA